MTKPPPRRQAYCYVRHKKGRPLRGGQFGSLWRSHDAVCQSVGRVGKTEKAPGLDFLGPGRGLSGSTDARADRPACKDLRMHTLAPMAIGPARVRQYRRRAGASQQVRVRVRVRVRCARRNNNCRELFSHRPRPHKRLPHPERGIVLRRRQPLNGNRHGNQPSRNFPWSARLALRPPCHSRA